ncbi:hypothetical protein [Hahella sp. NBU794]|uniref:hypothetical protein n=1 Tax=Hahella sp. NBU794 TaxID=3422590 RepID=UPI003D6FFC1A
MTDELEKKIRRLSPPKQKEFIELSQFLDYFSTVYEDIPPEDPVHPSHALDSTLDEFGAAAALTGLREAIKDIIEDTLDVDAETLQQVDADLSTNGLITLSALRYRYWTKIAGIRKRGRIRNELEYHMISGLLADTENELSEEDTELFNQMLMDYESR